VALAGALLAWRGGLARYRADGTRVSRRWAALALPLCIALAWYGAGAKGERRHMQFYFENSTFRPFTHPGRDAGGAVAWSAVGGGTRAAAAGPDFGFRHRANGCKPPHIILIHEESVVQPSLFRRCATTTVDPFFHSYDDRTHRLRVETYCGASWLTEFSLLAGVSTQAFGGMRQFVQTFTQTSSKTPCAGARALRLTATSCSTRCCAFRLQRPVYIRSGSRRSSTCARRGQDRQERDRFTSATPWPRWSALQVVAQPLFMFIQTMSAHWPTTSSTSRTSSARRRPGTNPEMTSICAASRWQIDSIS